MFRGSRLDHIKKGSDMVSLRLLNEVMIGCITSMVIRTLRKWLQDARISKHVAIAEPYLFPS